ncbi:MAG: lysophospholipid acyltransferase family protein [Bacillota bacterium]|nr:lysophospholipid acyltransferase family protein [Bacillota bacterium]
MLYRVVYLVGRFIFRIMGLSSEGIENLPAEGPVIIAANHVSNWDPIVVGLMINRPVHFMGKAELFNNQLLGTLLLKLNAFPVKRGAADRKAIRTALERLQQGNVLGIFPEGARNKTGEDLKPQLGVAMLALKSGAPIVPVACVGTDCRFPFGWFRPLRVIVGEPILTAEGMQKKVSSAEMSNLSEEIMLKINLLLSK